MLFLDAKLIFSLFPPCIIKNVSMSHFANEVDWFDPNLFILIINTGDFIRFISEGKERRTAREQKLDQRDNITV